MKLSYYRYYKDRDFSEVKISNADIVAVIQNPKQLQRVIDEHNVLIDEIYYLRKVVKAAKKSLPIVLLGEDYASLLKSISELDSFYEES